MWRRRIVRRARRPGRLATLSHAARAGPRAHHCAHPHALRAEAPTRLPGDRACEPQELAGTGPSRDQRRSGCDKGRDSRCRRRAMLTLLR